MNRYIKAMEIGNRYENEGISYFELREFLIKGEFIEIESDSEATFLFWFIVNFERYKDTKYFKKQIQNYIKNQKSRGWIEKVEPTLNDKWFLKGEASKQYIDYLELQQARESSKKALRKANTSIWIAIGTLLISIAFSWMTYNKPESPYPAPPYEVKLNQPVKLDDESIDKIRVLTKDSLK